MDIESFQKSNAGRLVKVGSGMKADWAFVPHPLPPALSVDMELMHQLSEASRALGELAGLGRMMPNPQLFVRPFIRREAVLSSRIEGTITNLRDLYAYEGKQLLLPFIKPSTPFSDVREVGARHASPLLCFGNGVWFGATQYLAGQLATDTRVTRTVDGRRPR